MPRSHLALAPQMPDVDAQTSAAAQEWLARTPTEYLMCRNNHAFPKLISNSGKLPRGVTATSEPHGRAGSMQIRQKCRDCGTLRVFTYQAGSDLYAASRDYRYEWPDGYLMPKGAGGVVSSADCKAEGMSRDDLAELLAASAAAGKRRRP